MLGIQVTRKWRTPQPLSYFFYCFGCSHQEKVKYAWTLIILFLMLWVLKSRESEGRLNYCHTFSIALGTQIKIKWVTSLLSYFFYCLGHSSHKKVEDVSSIIILFLVPWVLTSRESGGRLNYYHTFLLLFVLKSRESRERLSCHHTVSITLGLQVTRKWRTPSYCNAFYLDLGTQVTTKSRTSQL